MTDKKVCVAVVGAGLVGSLEACFLAQRGMEVMKRFIFWFEETKEIF